MKLNQFEAVSPSQCTVLALLTVTLMFFAPSVKAQNVTSVPAPELKLISVKVEMEKSTRLDVESVSTNNNVRPTETFVYRPELGNAPQAGAQYEQYVRSPIRNMYTVLRMTNEGTKAIKSIDWEYTSPHFDGGKIVKYKKTTSHMKLGSGESATLRKKLSEEQDCSMFLNYLMGEQALNTSCGRKHSKSTGLHLIEARLLKVTYEDGTVWKKP